MTSGVRFARLATRVGASSLLAMSVAGMAQQAQAQDASREAAAAQGDNGSPLGEIVVTAQRRGENLQRVPIAVSAVNAQALDAAGVRNAADLGRIVPGLSVFSTTGAVQPFLRGVGTSSSIQGYESSVAVYLDDAYVSRVPPSLLELSSIERVEVLKGPQGTLFGRNASSGLIHIVTRDPSHDPVIEGAVGLGNYGTFRGRIYASTGLTDTLAVDIAGLVTDQDKGWGRNVATGRGWGKDRTKAVRGKLKWEPTPDTTVTLSADYTRSDNDFLATSQYLYGPRRGYSQPPYGLQPVLGFYDIEADVSPDIQQKNYGFSGKIAHEFAFATLSSITTYRKDKGYQVFESDFTKQPNLRADLFGFAKAFSQELQLASNGSGGLTWIAGLYYLDSRAGYLPSRFTGDSVDAAGPLLGLPAGTKMVSDVYGENRDKSYAAYAQASYKLGSGTRITLGARYTRDEISGHGISQLYPAGGTRLTISTIDQSTAFEKFTYKVALDQQVTPDILVYVSQSRGYKAGLYNTLPVGTTPARPEVLDASEIGIKSELFGRRLRLNAAAFYYKLQDAQFQQFNGPNVLVINAKGARIWGAELEGQASVTDNLRLRFSGGYLDTRYTDFKNAQTPVLNPNTDPATGPVGGYLPDLGSFDASGNRIVRAPKWTANVGANYRVDTAVGAFEFDVNYAYTSEFNWDADNVLKQPAYGLLDAQARYTFPGQDRFSIAIWGKNLGNEKYYLAEVQSAGARASSAMPGAPRTYGFDWIFKF